jgi:adenylate cyclase
MALHRLIRPIRLSGFKIALLVIAACVVFYVLYGQCIPFLTILELKTLDLKFRLSGTRPPSDEVVIVAIDDYSIENLGRWPWPRSYYAEAVDKLAEDGASVIGLDLILSEPEESAGMDMLRDLRYYYGNLHMSSSSPEGKEFRDILDQAITNADNDRIFADSIGRNGNIVLALVFLFPEISDQPEQTDFPKKVGHAPLEESDLGDLPPLEEFQEETDAGSDLGDLPPLEGFQDETGSGGEYYVPPEVEAAAFRYVEGDEKDYLPEATDVMLPLSDYYSSASNLGHINAYPDIDGGLRWETLVVEFNGQYYPALGVQLVKEHLGLAGEDVRLLPGRGVRLGERFCPLDGEGRMLVNYYGPGWSFPYYSFFDVVAGTLPEGTFRDKMVLVGAAATGLGDVWSTPFSRAMPGVEKHATVISNIMLGDYLRMSNMVLDILFILVPGVALGLVLPRCSSLRGLSWAFLMLLAVTAVNYAFFHYQNTWVAYVFPTASLIAISVAVTTFQYFTGEKERRFVKKAFRQYLNPALLEELMKNTDGLRLGGEKKELTVLFSDIRGFTTISERMPPEQLVSMINEYLSAMTGIITSNKGLVDKFIGDAIMAVFGAPVSFEGHPTAACMAALKMREELTRLSPQWKEKGYPEMKIGIGINTGEMIVGNMGSEERFDYTVMGDSVNLASRLEGLCKLYGADIVISEFAADRIEGFALRELDVVKVKGKEQPIRVFELLGLDGSPEINYEEVREYQDSLALYRARRWEEAREKFAALAGKAGSPLYGLYKKRCEEFLERPPSEDWDGLFVLREK